MAVYAVVLVYLFSIDLFYSSILSIIPLLIADSELLAFVRLSK